MVETDLEQERPLRILHVLRAPLGGLWRHVVDLTREQVARGHAVGLVTDSLTGGKRADALLEDLAPDLSLRVSRVAMQRNPHFSDIRAIAHVNRRIVETKPDVVHGHGSKGGVLARLPTFLPGTRNAVRAYTPHGGSLNYRPGTALHRLYMKVEAGLQRNTDLILFESSFISARYGAYVGRFPRFHRVIHNGIGASEFQPVVPNADATDFVYVGELRSAKGIDTLLAAVARATPELDRPPTLTLIGSGPDRSLLSEQAAQLGLGNRITFHDPMPARQAFAHGRTLVVPSRAESLPYIVLEAAGARIPMVSTNVGGIPEIFGPFSRRLISADSVPDLADSMIDAMTMPAERKRAEALALAEHVREHFSIERMVDAVLSSYRDVRLARVAGPGLKPPFPLAFSP